MTQPTDATSEPVHWFTRLDQAIVASDWEEAQLVQQKLEEFGYYVKYFAPRRRRNQSPRNCNTSTKGGST